MTSDTPPSASVNSPSVSGLSAPAVLGALRCPLCAETFAVAGRSLRCGRGHSFDVARQGYVNLLHAGVPARTADTPVMVAARAAFLGAGHYAPLGQAVARACAAGSGLVLDAGAGTGYYLAATLDALPDATGLALDLSAAACRRAARAHPRAAAAVWNTWQPLPLASGCAAVVLDVFAPRNGAEFRRVLRDDGVLVVVTPTPEHLAELASVTLEVDPEKERRLDEGLSRHFRRVDTTDVRYPLELTSDEARTLIEMGPTAHHLSPGALDALPETVRVTVSCTVGVYRPREAAA